MTQFVRLSLSVEAVAHLEIALALQLSRDEDAYAFLIGDGLPPTNDEARFLAQSIGGMRDLLEAWRSAVDVQLVIPLTEAPADAPARPDRDP